eukprot:COSAG01_NODE_1821_length_9119_cov_4.375345_15_plen_130_part_00
MPGGCGGGAAASTAVGTGAADRLSGPFPQIHDTNWRAIGQSQSMWTDSKFHPQFHDTNRRAIGQSQSMWTDSKRQCGPNTVSPAITCPNLGHRRRPAHVAGAGGGRPLPPPRRRRGCVHGRRHPGGGTL